MPGHTLTTPETLARRIGAPDAPVLIDVCIDDDFALDPRLIPGATRHTFTSVEDLAPDLGDRTAIVICQKGKKLSQGAAAVLRASGVDATALAGGMVGWAARGYPAIPAIAMPSPRVVTCEAPSNDALAALWLVKRFARRDVSILCVPAADAQAVADKFAATLLPSYNDLRRRLTLTAPALFQIGEICAGTAPESPGVAATLDGMRGLYPDDLSRVTSALPLFDALHHALTDDTDSRTDMGAKA